ncbi:hypothetical protein KKA15_05475 [Patescibacteria group bacterium]|nr:hypothetical protein [Patescibacteria group bacterium]
MTKNNSSKKEVEIDSTKVEVSKNEVTNKTNDNQSQVEIVNWQKDRVKWVSLVISIITALIAIFTFGFVLINAMYLERAMISVSDFSVSYVNDEATGETQGVLLNYKISNYGKVQAENLKIEVYAISIEDNSIESKDWAIGIPSAIYPDTSFPFGYHIYKDICTANSNKPIALVFDFTYNDAKGELTSQMWFKYNIGSKNVKYLIEDEQNKIFDKYKALKNN